jgi:hypothetical protein
MKGRSGPIAKGGGAQDFGGGSPAEDPTDDLERAAGAKGSPDAAIV